MLDRRVTPCVKDAQQGRVAVQTQLTALLMERYVLLYSQKKDPSTLVSDSRGPVDLYNQLVDLLRHVAQENGLREEVGKSFEFLAKDIMHWNRSWDDDAFAGGKVRYGWTDWLEGVRHRKWGEEAKWTAET